MDFFKKVKNTANFAVVALAVSIFVACSGIAGDSGSSSQNYAQTSSSGKKLITFCGTVGMDGAVPQALIPNGGTDARTADPALEIGSEKCHYFVTAEPINGNPAAKIECTDPSAFKPTASGMTFALGLTEGSWKITAGIKNKDNKIILASQVSPTLTATQAVFNHTFIAEPSFAEVTDGSIGLTLNGAGAGIDKLRISCSDDAWKTAVSTQATAPDSGVIELTSSGGSFALSVASIPAGAYSVVFDFYKSGTMAYSTVQTLNVFGGMLTNTWVSGGGTDADVISGGGFVLDDDDVSAFGKTIYYVGDTGAPGAKDPDDKNSGSSREPLKTLQKAVDRIALSGNNSSDYKIFVGGTVEGNAKLASGLNTKARSIEIQGLNQPSSGQSPTDTLAGGLYTTQMEVLSVETSVPISIRGVKITRDPSETVSASRGVLVNATGAKVTLLDGTEISGHNPAANYGGGVYVYSGTLCIKGAVIKQNTAELGGGVCVNSNNVMEMSSGEISDNTSTDSGGAVYVSVNSQFKISGSARVPYGTGKKNDVYLERTGEGDTATQACITVAGALTGSGEGDVATITPQGWARKSAVLKAESSIITADVAKRFKITDGDFKINKKDDGKSAILSAPIYVAGTGYRICETDGSNEGAGTKAQPYATLAKALAVIDGGGAEVIYIDGKLTGGNSIPDTFKAVTCSELTIKGASDTTHPAFVDEEPANSFDGGNMNRVLDINTLVPVVLEDIKIANGKAPSGENGGGVRITGTSDSVRANLTLKNVLITSNKIAGGNANGVGLYAFNANVTMQSGSISGNDGTNSADIHGGGVGLGQSKFVMNGGKISGNKAKNYGANVYMNNSTSEFVLNDGEISDGLTTSTSTDANAGCAWIDGGATFTMKGGVIKNNKTNTTGSGKKSQGGAFYIASGTFDMQGGEMSGNISEGTGHRGGAVFLGVSGNIKVSGSAYIPYISDSNNDIYLPSGKTVTIAGNLSLPTGAPSTAKNATVTLENWKRKTKYLSAESEDLLSDANKSKIALALDDTGWEKDNIVELSKNYVIIDSPIYVAGTSNRGTCSAAPSAGNNGTKTRPYATIAAALASSDLSEAGGKIKVDGILTAGQSISGTISVSSLTLEGYNTNAKIQPTSGSALTVNASGKAVTIKNLTITGGSAASGAGINLSAGTVNLDSGAKVTANNATSGGNGAGVYVASGATLNIKTGSEISSNMAVSGNIQGGGVYNAGTVNLQGGSLYKNVANIGGGIYNKGALSITSGTIGGSTTNANSAADSGGGIYSDVDATSFAMSGGSVTYNKITGTHTSFQHGGAGLYIASSGSVTGGYIQNNSATNSYGGGIYCGSSDGFEISGGTISANSAKYGGGVYHENGLTISGGTFSGNTAGTSGAGGAIYAYGTFTVKNNALIYTSNDAVRTNDVYLDGTEKPTIYVASTPNKTTVASITLPNYKRGTEILSTPKSGVTLNTTLYSKFKLTSDDSGWERNSDTSDPDAQYVYIYSPIYVVSSSGTAPTGFTNGKPSGANGTKTSPYASIAAAAQASDLAEASGKITVVGTLTGTQSISSVTNGVSAVTLAGYDTNATINGNAGGSALIISTAKIFTIKDLAITNGKADAGGGINITAGTVNLDSGAKVYSNKANSGKNGAGIYVKSGATLNIKDGSAIYSNLADSGTIYGGGVYNAGTVDMTGGQIYNNTAYDGGGIYNTGTFYVRGTALIGDATSNTNTATGNTAGSTCSNSAANYGGGIYNSGNLYVGCNSSGSSSATGYALSTGYGVRRNHAKSGGAIYLGGGTFKAASGTVSYNHATSGGAIYVSSGTGHVLGAVSLASNKVSSAGGALYLDYSTKLTVNGTAEFIVNSAEATSGSNNPCGGAVYNYGTLEIAANATMKGNFSKVSGSGTGKAYGGAIANYGTLTMSSGTIGVSGVPNSVSNTVSGYTANAYGGAIYQNGTFNVSGSTKVLPGTERSNDVFLVSGKVVNVAGSIGTSGNTSTSQMAITPSTWKRGTQVLSFGSGVTASNEIDKFKGTETDWKTIVDSSVGKLYTEYKIYVSSSGTASGTGTSSNPYNSISTAVDQCWTTGKDFTIYVSGNLSGQQTIPAANSTNKTGLAKSITLSGKNGSSSDGINRNLTSASATGTALVINTSYPVTLTKLKIQKGYSSTNGGGISTTTAALTIGSDVVITNNKAASYGGGIYSLKNVTINSSTSEISSNTAACGGGIYIGKTSSIVLTMSDGKIYSNTANGTTNDDNGGVYVELGKFNMSGGSIYSNIASKNGAGVHLNDGYFYMTGSAIIGSTSTSLTTYPSQKSNASNRADGNGGGLYATVDSTVKLGINSSGTTAGLTGGIIYNSATKGGGIYMPGNEPLTFVAGNVNYNYADQGGGIWTKPGAYMSGGTIKGNTATTSGGGVFNEGNFCMSGTATIGVLKTTYTDYATSSTSKHSNRAKFGAGIYNSVGTVYLGYSAAGTYASSFTGGIGYNYADYGAGIYSSSNCNIAGGTISNNYCQYDGGGAISIDDASKTIYFGGNAYVPAGTTKHQNDVYLKASGAKIGVLGDKLPTKSTVATITPYTYNTNTQVMGTDSAAVGAMCFDVIPNGTTTYTISTSTGKLQTSTVMTGTSIASFSASDITSGTSYNFVMDSSVTNDDFKAFLSKICSKNSGYNIGEKVIGESTLDLSKTSITSFNHDGNNAAQVFQKFSTVILSPSMTTNTFKGYSSAYVLKNTKKYIVPPSSQYLCADEDGVVYNKNKTILVKYPTGRLDTNFTIPYTTVKTIGEAAFWGADYLQGISMSNVTAFEQYAFGNSCLTSVTIPSGVTRIPTECFNSCEYLYTVSFTGNTVQELDSNAFSECKRLKTITLPTSLKTIGIYAFYKSFTETNTTMNIPSGVTLIKKEAFIGASKLTLTFTYTNGWSKSSTESGTYTSVNTSDMTSANVVSGSLSSYYLKRN